MYILICVCLRQATNCEILPHKSSFRRIKNGFFYPSCCWHPFRRNFKWRHAKPERLKNKQLLFQNLDYALDLYLIIYVLTLFIFPGFVFENTGSHQLGSRYRVVLIAMYNVLDLIGRYTPLVESIKLESRKGLLIASLSRFLLIPALYFTAKYCDQGYMILLVSFLGLTNGHLTVCDLTVAPKGYKAPEQNALGNLLVLFLLFGIFSGVALDWLGIIGNGKF